MYVFFRWVLLPSVPTSTASPVCTWWESTMPNLKGYHLFTFSSHTEYVKRESIVIAWVKKKNVCLRRQKKQKKFPPVCLSDCTWTFPVDTITFVEISGFKEQFGRCLLCMKCRSGIEIQSKIMILILILILTRILILTKTTPNLMGIFSIWRITFSN